MFAKTEKYKNGIVSAFLVLVPLMAESLMNKFEGSLKSVFWMLSDSTQPEGSCCRHRRFESLIMSLASQKR